MDSRTKWLLAGFVYMLGCLGVFLITFFDVRKQLSSDMHAVEEAGIAALIWPYTLIQLIL